MGDLFILVAVNVAGLFAIFFFLKMKIRKTLEIDGLLAEARKEVRLLSIEMNETTDRNVTLVEDRLASLRELLAEADRRMGVFQRETGKRQDERELYSRLGRKTPLPSREPIDGFVASVPSPPQRSPSTFPADAGRSDLGEAEGGAEPVRLTLARPVPEVLPMKESVIPVKSLRERALELHRGGFSADLIAARVGATVSEIELLVSLEEGRREVFAREVIAREGIAADNAALEEGP